MRWGANFGRKSWRFLDRQLLSSRLMKRERRDDGFSLIEVLVALIVVTTAVMGTAGMLVVAARAARDARTQSVAVVLASQKLEQLRALEWSADDWTGHGAPASDTATDVARDPPAAGGGGLSESPPGSLLVNVPGFVDFLDASGRWVGSGASAPPRAAFIRRWAIGRLPDDPAGNTLVVQVLVTTVVRDAAILRGGGPRRRYLGDALVTTVRTRLSR